MKGSQLVIALDGPSGSGKSSVARTVAKNLGYRYLDTGAMYRAITWWMLCHHVDVDDADTVTALVDKPQLEMGTDPEAPTVHVDGMDASGPIRTREVTNAVSAISAVPEVRRRMVGMQVDIIDRGGIVVEGRDIGTVVAPSAAVKVFLTASSEERAQRRTRELTHEPPRAAATGSPRKTGESGDVTVELTHAELARRDRFDSGRAASPLTMAEGAVEIDSTALRFDEVVEAVLRLVRERAEGGVDE